MKTHTDCRSSHRPTLKHMHAVSCTDTFLSQSSLWLAPAYSCGMKYTSANPCSGQYLFAAIAKTRRIMKTTRRDSITDTDCASKQRRSPEDHSPGQLLNKYGLCLSLCLSVITWQWGSGRAVTPDPTTVTWRPAPEDHHLKWQFPAGRKPVDLARGRTPHLRFRPETQSRLAPPLLMSLLMGLDPVTWPNFPHESGTLVGETKKKKTS